MYHSAEIRWYFAGRPPAAVASWFEAGGRAVRERERIDEYLALPGCETTGVKVRQGRIEVKAQTAAPALVDYPNGVRGFKDAWVKWSSRVSDGGSLRQLVTNPDDRWIFVEKSRSLRKFTLEAGGPREVSAETSFASRGCQLEITAIRVLADEAGAGALPADAWRRASPWWSLSFEAFGDPPTLNESLDLVASEVFREPPPIALTAAASFSYPVWLARHA